MLLYASAKKLGEWRHTEIQHKIFAGEAVTNTTLSEKFSSFWNSEF